MDYYNRELIFKLNSISIEGVNIDNIIDSVWKFDFDNSIMFKVKKLDVYVKKCVYSLEHYLLNCDIKLKEYNIIKEILFCLESIQDVIHNYLMHILIQENITINTKEMVKYINNVESKMKLLKI